jgi:hypothetical protein
MEYFCFGGSRRPLVFFGSADSKGLSGRLAWKCEFQKGQPTEKQDSGSEEWAQFFTKTSVAQIEVLVKHYYVLVTD